MGETTDNNDSYNDEAVALLHYLPGLNPVKKKIQFTYRGLR